MSKITSNTSQLNDSWDTYWQGTSNANAYDSGGARHPAVGAFWETFFEAVKQDYDNPSILDIASGNGAVVESALAAFKNKPSAITSQDISAAAIDNIHKRFPTVQGIVSDASSIPRETASFDIVTSQFGVEYAGHEAIFEAARLVANGGQLALLLHIDSGCIHQQCQQNLDAIKRIRACQFMPLVSQMFEAGINAMRSGERSAYKKAAHQFTPAIRELEAIMKQYGHRVASNTISRLYSDVRQIHQRLEHYEPDKILGWLKKMDEELDAYAQRMSSMCQSSVNKANFMQIESGLLARGFSIQSADTLVVPDNELPIAWRLVARK